MNKYSATETDEAPTDPSVSDLVTELKGVTLPTLFRDGNTIVAYGRSTDEEMMSELGDLMEGSPVSRLAAKITEIIERLADADPQRIAKPPGWLERFTGKAVETHARYQVARKDLDRLLADAEGQAQVVRDAAAAIDRLISRHAAEAGRLQAHVQAGREFMAENPQIGQPRRGAFDFDNLRERFARRLANLATLLASHEMSVTQMKLTKAQAVDLLDRYEETARVLVPVWRQHTLALTATQHMNPAMVAEATKAHEALMRSLVQSKNGIER